MITTLLFDLDNTLIATREIDELACKDVSSRASRDICCDFDILFFISIHILGLLGPAQSTEYAQYGRYQPHFTV